ncbi:MAG: hypothetical protein GKR91_11450 [Pseudomonadales bacterium]|nr:hypothetical protein [Pseudomonadales bacterium]
MKYSVFSFLLLFLHSAAFTQDYSVPRTEYDHPDLNGVWNFNDSTPFERPDRYGNREFLNNEELAARDENLATGQERRDASESAVSDRILNVPTNDTGAYNLFWSFYDEPYPNNRTSLVTYPSNGKIPATQTGVITQRSPPGSNPCNYGGIVISDRPVRVSWGAVSCDRPEDFGLASRCMAFPQTFPPHIKANSYNNNLQIVQTKDHVMIRPELGNDPRIIPLDGRPFLTEEIRNWTGSSRGHYDGDTLVVETRHFTDKLASLFLRTYSYGTAENMVLTERFTRVGENALDYEFTIDDPTTFVDRITVKTNMSLLGAPIYEFACHEGNYALENMLRAARIVDRQ